MPAPTLSAVIVTYNSAHVVARCLRSLRSHLPEAEIVIIDNASEDESVQRCSTFANVAANATNVGFGRACNQGALGAAGSHLLFLNPDVEIVAANGPGLLTELRREPVGLLGALLEGGPGAPPSMLPHRAWPWEVIEHSFGTLRPRELPALPRPARRQRSLWPPGAALLCSRTEFLRLGGFRPEFFLYYEDRDLARRYREAGLPIGVTRSLAARHTAGTSSASEDDLRVVPAGWAYLAWLEYLAIWHGDATARRAARLVHGLRDCAERLLGAPASHRPLAGRVARKRSQMHAIDDLVRRHGRDAGPAVGDIFCPRARRIVADVVGDGPGAGASVE